MWQNLSKTTPVGIVTFMSTTTDVVISDNYIVKLKGTIMKFPITAIAITVYALTTGSAAHAGDVEHAIIAKVAQGYGGDRFTDMKSITYTETSYVGGAGQGVDAGFSPHQTQKRVTVFDLKGLRGSVENFASEDSFFYHSRNTSTPDDIVTINYATGNYQPESSENYYQFMGPMTRSIDTMLAYELVRSPELAEAKGQTNYKGRRHHLVTYNLPKSPPLTLYIDDASGHITRMQRVTPFGALEYIFSKFDTAGGVDYAQDFQFFADGRLNSHTIRSANVNTARNKDFTIDRGIEPEPERLASAEMSVDELGEGAYLVGQNSGYSLFIDNGSTIIGMGGYAGLEDRFKAYQEAAGHTKRLGTHIVTHHHSDHIAGIPEAYALGAKLIMTPDSVGPVKALIEGSVPDHRVEILNDDRDVGPVKLLRVSTSHADENIMPYIPALKTLFQADHYGSPYPDKTGLVNGNGLLMKKAVEAKGLEIERLISAHGRKVEDWNLFVAAANNSTPYKCYKGRKICR